MRTHSTKAVIGLVVAAVGAACGGRPAGRGLLATAAEPRQVAAVGTDSLRLVATWVHGTPVPPGSSISYWITWSRNGQRILSDTTPGPPHRVAVRRMGNGVPDTVLVTLWTLNHGVLSRRATWTERIFLPSVSAVDTIDLGQAEPPESNVPSAAARNGGAAPVPAAPAGRDEPAEPTSPVAPAPRPADAAPAAVTPPSQVAEPPRPLQRVVLRVMNPPPSWAAKGWSLDCPAALSPDGLLRLVVVAGTPEHCKPYVSSYGGQGARR